MGGTTTPSGASRPPIGQFLEARPSEGAEPKLRTEARVAYDEHNLYVFVRAFDPHPDSIVSLLSRRDDQTASDYVTLMLDPYHDRRTGYEFSVNPAGVKTDYAIYNDGDEDVAWDAVWDAATRIDSLGWTAEYPHPAVAAALLVQGRRHVRPAHLAGDPAAHRDGHLAALPHVAIRPRLAVRRLSPGSTGWAVPGHAEITPYVVTKNVQDAGSTRLRAKPGRLGRRRPQVPARLEPAAQRDRQSRFRPGRGRSVGAQPQRVRDLLQRAAAVLRGREGPLHLHGELRRRGRLQHRRGPVLLPPDRALPAAGRRSTATRPRATATKILGAGKVTGRLPGGFSLGVLDAVTDHVAGPGATTLEPATNYGVVRGNQDFRNGDGSVGFIVTGVNRSLDATSAPYLHRSAYTGGVDARWRFHGRYEVSGSLDLSRVAGDPAAIALTQRDPVHLYQRPGRPARRSTRPGPR